LWDGAPTGNIDPFTGIIGDVGTLSGWQGGKLVEEFERAFGVRVAVENDADAPAIWSSGDR
jgi:predicted NBD/HSP70 family sugar kinase